MLSAEGESGTRSHQRTLGYPRGQSCAGRWLREFQFWPNVSCGSNRPGPPSPAAWRGFFIRGVGEGRGTKAVELKASTKLPLIVGCRYSHLGNPRKELSPAPAGFFLRGG